jgi:hypothetical protein
LIAHFFVFEALTEDIHRSAASASILPVKAAGGQQPNAGFLTRLDKQNRRGTNTSPAAW